MTFYLLCYVMSLIIGMVEWVDHENIKIRLTHSTSGPRILRLCCSLFWLFIRTFCGTKKIFLLNLDLLLPSCYSHKTIFWNVTTWIGSETLFTFMRTCCPRIELGFLFHMIFRLKFNVVISKWWICFRCYCPYTSV